MLQIQLGFPCKNHLFDHSEATKIQDKSYLSALLVSFPDSSSDPDSASLELSSVCSGVSGVGSAKWGLFGADAIVLISCVLFYAFEAASSASKTTNLSGTKFDYVVVELPSPRCVLFMCFEVFAGMHVRYIPQWTENLSQVPRLISFNSH